MTGEACIEFRQLEMIWKRSYSLQIHIIYSPKKTADISRRHHWFPSLPHRRTRSLPAWRTLRGRLQVSTRNDVRGTSAEIPYWWRVTSDSDWSCRDGILLQLPLQLIRGTTQIWLATRHQYGIPALVPQNSFDAETSGGVAKCWLFSQANHSPTPLTHNPRPKSNSSLKQGWHIWVAKPENRNASAPSRIAHVQIPLPISPQEKSEKSLWSSDY